MKRLLPLLLIFGYSFREIDTGTIHSGQPQIDTSKNSANSGALFLTDTPLQFSLSGNIRDLFNDRSDAPAYHTLTLSYGKGSQLISIPLKARTRGNFRLRKSNCTYPPILLNFSKVGTKGTMFEQQDKLKLVMPCRNETYVIREYLVYKLYNLITPESFRARMANVTFTDTVKERQTNLLAMLLESDEQVAERNGLQIMTKTALHGENTEEEAFLRMAVFQFMIGNTDWSVEYLHNIRLLSADPLSIPSVVPYDFDHAGIVQAPYAHPAEELELASTRIRRYRGYCVRDEKAFDKTVQLFNRLKPDFYAIYQQCNLIDAAYRKSSIAYLDQFYDILNNPVKRKEAFGYPCRKDIPVIVIRGLDKKGRQ